MNRAHQTAELSADLNNSDQKPFAPSPLGTAFIVRDQRDQQLQKIESENTWFLDFCTSYHLCNNPSLFTDKRAKSIDFVTALRQVIETKGIGIVSISLADGSKIELQNVALALRYDSNLISFGQLWETEITFHDDPTAMILMRNGKIIA